MKTNQCHVLLLFLFFSGLCFDLCGQCTTDITGIGFGINNVCLPMPMSLNYQASNSNPNWTYTWSVSPGGTLMSAQGGPNMAIQWNSAGAGACAEWVNISVSDGQGCVYDYGIDHGTNGKCIVIGNTPSGTISGPGFGTSANSWACEYDPPSHNLSTYQFQPILANCSYNWSVTDASIDSGQGTPEIKVRWFPPPTTYNPSLSVIVTDMTTGCAVGEQTWVLVSPRFPSHPITGPTTAVADSCPVLYNSTVWCNNVPTNTFTINYYSTTNGIAGATSTPYCGGGMMSTWINGPFNVWFTAPGFQEVRFTQYVSYSYCPSTSVYNVNVLPGIPPNATIHGPSLICRGDTQLYHGAFNANNAMQWSVTNGMIIGPTNGDSIYVHWNGSSNVVGTVSILAAGSGCSDSSTINVNMVRAEISGDLSPCIGASRTYHSGLNNSAAVFTWGIVGGNILSGQGTASVSVSWNALGTNKLWVSVTNGGCVATDTILASVQASLVANLGNDTTLCMGQTLLLSTGPGFMSNQWFPGGNYGATKTVTAGGTYIVHATDTAGCLDRDTIVVSYEADPVLNPSGSQNMCNGDTMIVGTTTPFVSYLWSTGSTDSSILVTQSGIYGVTTTSMHGCTGNSNALNLTALPAPGGAIILSGNGLYYAPNFGSAYIWYLNGVPTGDTTVYIAAVLPGTYQVWVMGNNNCDGWSDPLYINVIGLDTGNAVGWELLPNPAQNAVMVRGNFGAESLWSISIKSLQGQLLKYQELLLDHGDVKLELDGIGSGAYLVEISNGVQVFRKRLLVQK